MTTTMSNSSNDDDAAAAAASDSPRMDTTEMTRSSSGDPVVMESSSWDPEEDVEQGRRQEEIGIAQQQSQRRNRRLQRPNLEHASSSSRKQHSSFGLQQNNSYSRNSKDSPQACRLLSQCTSSFQGDGDRYDEALLHRAVEDAGRWAYGTVLVEVWLMNEARTQLYRPECGWWIDPIYHSHCDGASNGVQGSSNAFCQICRLTNRRRKDFVAPAPLAPGVGLPGALWAADEFWGGHNNNQTPSVSSGQRQQSMLNLFKGGGIGGDDGCGEGQNNIAYSVAWREVKALADDPDQPWNPRLQLLAELGLGWAAAVPLRNPDPHADAAKQGIVIFMAREGVDGRRLLSPSNESYLVSASNLIAAALAVRAPRHEAIRERRMEVESAIRRVRSKILSARLVGKSLAEIVEENEEKSQRELRNQRPDQVSGTTCASGMIMRLDRYGGAIHRKVTSTLHKTRGANVKPPPTFSWDQTLLTFCGVFITILMLTFWSQFMTDTFGGDYRLVMGPFGAFLTLLYGLTAAPASQPKNAILGQVISISISLAFGYAKNMHPHLRTSLTTAVVVATMVKLGLTHPPAGAAALVFSSGLFGWTHMAVLLVGNVMAILVATIVNNLSDRRQYPTYWSFGFLVHLFRPLDDEEVLKSSARRGFFRLPRVSAPSKGKPS